MKYLINLCLVSALFGWQVAEAQLYETSSISAIPSNSDRVYITDEGPDLDECVFNAGDPNTSGWPVARPNGELQIEVDIDRYIGQVNINGFLDDPQTLIDNKVIGATAKVRIAAKRPILDSGTTFGFVFYDPQYTAPGSELIEAQESPVYLHKGTFQEHKVGLLTGEYRSVQHSEGIYWVIHEFDVPIEHLKFPQRVDSPTTLDPTLVPAKNVFSVVVDANNQHLPYYGKCMAVDWISVSIDAISPILLVHGTAAQSDTWEKPDGQNFLTHLETIGVPNSYNIDMVANGFSEANAKILKSRVAAIAKSFGTDSVHLVGHSKGGNDARRYLHQHHIPNANPKVLSLTTISTPHEGTVISDLQITSEKNGFLASENDDIVDFFKTAPLGYVGGQFDLGPSGAALLQNATYVMSKFNRHNPFPPGIQLYTVTGDTDTSNDQIITGDENEIIPLTWTANAMYNILGKVNSYEIKKLPVDTNGLRRLQRVSTIVVNNNVDFRLNDTVVTEKSSLHPKGARLLSPNGTYVFDGDHSLTKSHEVAGAVIDKITTDFRLSNNL